MLIVLCQMVVLYQWIFSAYVYIKLFSSIHLCIYLYVFLTFLGWYYQNFFCLLYNATHPEAWCQSPPEQVIHDHNYYVSNANLSHLWLIQPDWVFVSLFAELSACIVIMFWSVPLLLAQPILSSDIICQESFFRLWWMKCSFHFPPTCCYVKHMSCVWVIYWVFLNWFWLQKCPLTIQSLVNLFLEVLFICIWCTAYVTGMFKLIVY